MTALWEPKMPETMHEEPTPGMTPERRKYLQDLQRAGGDCRRNNRVSWDCRVLGWSEFKWQDGYRRFLGEAITDKGLAALAHQGYAY